MANVTVEVVNQNNVTIGVVPPVTNTINLTPPPTQTVSINRGIVGPPGPNEIGGYPINVTTPQEYDALMFVSNSWTNIPQTEIADGGNF
jgi:hypothetical protein